MADHPHDRDREVLTDRERATHDTGRTTHGTGRTTHKSDRSSGGKKIAAIVAGLVVAVLLMFWLFSPDGNEAEFTETDVIVEETETAAETGLGTEETVGMGAESDEAIFESLDTETEEGLELEAVEEPTGEETYQAN